MLAYTRKSKNYTCDKQNSSQTSKTRDYKYQPSNQQNALYSPWKSQRPFKCWKRAAFRVYIYSQKALWIVPSAYCSKRRIRMRACHAHVLNPHLLFFSLSPVSLSLEGFLKGICDWRFRPYNTSPCLHTYYLTSGHFFKFIKRVLYIICTLSPL